MTKDKCPHCKEPMNLFIHKVRGQRSEVCYERQIAQLTERLEAMTVANEIINKNRSDLIDRLEAWRELHKWSDKDKYTGAMREIILKKLQDLGEI